MSGPVEVCPVQSKRELEEFIEFPYRLHAAEPHWVPPLRFERRAFYDPKRNPVSGFVRVQLFLARINGRTAGTIAAIRNDTHGQFHPEERQVGFFGAFECRPDQAVADALVEAAGAWLRREGFSVLRGPMNFTINHVIGLLVDGFDDDPTLAMPYNPRYYGALLEAAGFRMTRELYSYSLTAANRGERLDRVAARLADRPGIRIRPLDLSRLDAEMVLFCACNNEALTRHWGYLALTEREAIHFGRQIKPLMVPDLAFIAEMEGQPAGLIFSMPDANEAIKLARGRLSPLGLARLAWHLKVRGCSRLLFVALFVLPRFRQRGLDALLVQHAMASAFRQGFRRFETGWLDQDHQTLFRFLEQLGARRAKTYRIFDRPVD